MVSILVPSPINILLALRINLCIVKVISTFAAVNLPIADINHGPIIETLENNLNMRGGVIGFCNLSGIATFKVSPC